MTNRTASVLIGGKEYRLTPMTIAERKRGMKLAFEMSDLAKKGAFGLAEAEAFSDAVLGIIHASLRRAGSEITLEQIEESVSQEDVSHIFETLCAISMPSDFPVFGASHRTN
jgi:hypothetical protein